MSDGCPKNEKHRSYNARNEGPLETHDCTADRLTGVHKKHRRILEDTKETGLTQPSEPAQAQNAEKALLALLAVRT